MATISKPVRAAVIARDHRCVANFFWPHACADRMGGKHPPDSWGRLELDHVREDSQMGKEPPSKPEHLVALCGYAHQTSHWATRNRDLLRAYLEWVMIPGNVPRRDRLRFLLPLMNP